jgi:hypothetical protein
MRIVTVLVFCLGAAASAAEPIGANLLKNPGFEDGDVKVWIANGKPDAPIEPQLDGKVVHGGRRSLRSGRYNFCQLVPIRPARVYRVEAWMRSEEMRGNGAHVTVGAKAADGRTFVRGIWAMTPSLSGTTDWRRYERAELTFPEGAAYAWIACYGPQNTKREEAGGTAWFDDLVFRDSTLDPLDAVIKGRTLQGLKDATLSKLETPETQPLKTRAVGLCDRIADILAKGRDELTRKEALLATELVRELESLRVDARIEDLFRSDAELRKQKPSPQTRP